MTEGGEAKRIDVVFDVYKNDSINGAERLRRGEADSTQYRNVIPGHTINQWRKFLCGSTNKERLILVVTDE